MVRGILATCHVFLGRDVSEKDVWKMLREDYAAEPFVRIVKERSGIHRYPGPKLVVGTNYCDIGFEREPRPHFVRTAREDRVQARETTFAPCPIVLVAEPVRRKQQLQRRVLAVLHHELLNGGLYFRGV